MLNVSQDFLNSIGKPVLLNLFGTITIGNTTINWDKSIVERGKFNITDKCVKSSGFSVGSVNAGTLNMNIYLANYRAYDLLGGSISAFYGFSNENIPLGVFKITKSSPNGLGWISISASTQLIQANYYDDKESLPSTWLPKDTTPYYLLLSLCEHAHMTFGNTLEEIQAMPNGNQTFSMVDDSLTSSTTDCLSYLATILGGFVTCDRSTGHVIIKHFQTAPVWTVTPSLMYRGTLSIAGFTMNLAKVMAEFYTNGAFSAYGAAGLEELVGNPNNVVVDISDNPFLESVYKSTNIDYIIELLINVGDKIINVPYKPFSVSIAGNPALELGDCINIVDQNGISTTSVISQYSYTFMDKHTIKCVGEDSRLLNNVPVNQLKRSEEGINKRINSIARTSLMKKSDYIKLGENFQKGLLYCLYDDEVST